MGGKMGGYGDTGELEAKLELSVIRGEEKYSVGWREGDEMCCWVDALAGSGEMGAAALRLLW
jgi:hypothetical protein